MQGQDVGQAPSRVLPALGGPTAEAAVPHMHQESEEKKGPGTRCLTWSQVGQV